MKKDERNKLIGALLLGVLIGYFLFSGATSNAMSVIGGSSGGTCTDPTTNVTTTTPTDEGDRICTRVCVPKPPVCRDPEPECPVGTTWSCSGVLSATCGCFPPTTTPTTTPTDDGEGGLRGCLTNPSICLVDEYCDTYLNKCVDVA